MSCNKNGLGPLVECSEPIDTDSSSGNGTATQTVPQLAHAEWNERTNTVTTSTSTDPSPNAAAAPKRKRAGSRISLASLFSFSSAGHPHRERSRSGCSCGDEAVAMSSVSTSDLRSTGSGSGRIRGSDAGCVTVEEDDQQAMGDGQISASQQTDISHINKCCSSGKMRECPLCCMKQPIANFPRLLGCQHRSCRLCLMQYVETEIMESRVEVSCPECASNLHPTDIRKLVGNRKALIEKYEQFSLRRYLMTEPDARWCPAPDCGYAVIATSCASCPQLRCSRETCRTVFCYHCKSSWHPNQTCDEARRSRGGPTYRQIGGGPARRITNSSIDAHLKPGDVKACPRCHTYIVKMDDGSCNHMVCAMCSVEFCWLCLKEISDLHYLSPTGCTFWGKKPWTKKKKLLWQIGTLIGAPVGIALIAGLSIPGIIFGVPVFVGRKVHQRFILHSKARRRIITAACVAGSLVVSPVLAVMAVGVGVPIMLAYVYGVVPLSLCRNGGCGLSEGNSRQNVDNLNEEELWTGTPVLVEGEEKRELLGEAERQMDGNSLAPGFSMQSGMSAQQHARLAVQDVRRRPSVESGVNSIGERINYEEASTRAMAGSHYHYDDKSVHTLYSGHEVVSYNEEVASTRALAGSVFDSKSLSESLGQRHAATQVGCNPTCDDDGCMCNIPSSSTGSADHHHHKCGDDTSNGFMGATRKRADTRHTRTVNIAPSADDSEELLLSAEDMGDVETGVSSSHATRVAHFTIGGSQQAGSSHGERDDADPFKIRTLLDNMKQMVAADEVFDEHDRPYEMFLPRGASHAVPIQRVGRSGSGKSVATVATQSSEGVGVPAKKRGFFQSLFSSRRR